ncbi:DNA mismatch repair protein [Tulasnella sp. JGI-2019a]|nr:DNA mismatch repair protein [Tulasnella sp. JGI-2019a]
MISGEKALASAADVSCIEISTRDANANESWSVIAKGGEQVYYGPAVRWRRTKPGTVVSIRDAFYNLPIRRKSHPNAQRTIEMIRKELETYALISPGVAFTLEKTVYERDTKTRQVRVMTIPMSLSPLDAFHHIYGRALAERADEINIARSGVRVEGFISLHGALSKAQQFLYVNRHPVEQGTLHRCIDKAFAESSFSFHCLGKGETDKEAPTARRSPRKPDYKPVYCLNIQLPRDNVDASLLPNKSAVLFQDTRTIEDVISQVLMKFLRRNGFLPSSPSSSSTTDYAQEIAQDTGLYSKRRKVEISSSATQIRNNGARDPSLGVYAVPGSAGQPLVQWTDPTTGQTYLLDPSTGNSRPGTEIRPEEEQRDGGSAHACESHAHHSGMHVNRQWLKQTGAHLTNAGDISPSPNWITATLEKCREATFPTLEASISALYVTPDGLRRPQEQPTLKRNGAARIFSGRDLREDVKCRLVRDDLQRLEVLGQVDRKFVACMLRPQNNDHEGISSLLLVDQHAADERIRVERLLKDLAFGFLRSTITSQRVCRTPLQDPIPILLNSTESRYVGGDIHFQAFLSRWGFEVELPSSIRSVDGDEFAQIIVTTVPQVLCLKVPLVLLSPNTAMTNRLHLKLTSANELEIVIGGFIVMLQSDPHLSNQLETTATGDEGDATAWLPALKFCPAQLIDLINSKACRGAIMFNDPLTLTQCEALMSELSATVFPFQCAHGRPSMVPLTALNSENLQLSRQRAVNWTRLSLVVT